MFKPELALAAAARWGEPKSRRASAAFAPAGAAGGLAEQRQRRLSRLANIASTEKAAALARAADATVTGAGRQGAVLGSIGYERVIGTRDLLGLDFLELAIAIARGIGRVRQDNIFGTGVLVGPRLMMTNNHVIDEAGVKDGWSIDMDYQENSERAMLPVHSYKVRPDYFFYTNKALDFTIVGLEAVSDKGRPITAYPWVKMVGDTGKLEVGDPVNIIQHPNGGLKQIAFRENKVIALTDEKPDFLEYTTDTEPGSSGSGCFNDQWELVALHHSGVPKTDAGGKIVTTTNQVWKKGQSEDTIAWVGNEGVRISAIVKSLTAAALPASMKAVVGTMLGSEPPNPIGLARAQGDGAAIAVPDSPPGNATSVPLQVSATSQAGGTVQIPLTITVSVGAQPGVAVSQGDALAVEEESVTIDPDWAARKGYDPAFLGEKFAVALPSLTAAQLKTTAQVLPDFRAKSGKYKAYELRYWNYSVLMNTVYRTAWFSAANVDGAARPALPKRAGDKWFVDPRLPMDQQLGEVAFETGIDRGHLTRRDDAAWGATAEIATKSTNDTFHFTNCSLQIAAFNRGADRWQGLEQFLLEKHAKKDKRRIVVFTGPVFDAKNPVYRNDKMTFSAPCPLNFWKVCVLVRESDGKLSSTGFVLGQPEISKLPGFEAFDVGASQVTLEQLEKMTALSFGKLKTYDNFAKTGKTGTLEAMVAAGKQRALRDVSDIVV